MAFQDEAVWAAADWKWDPYTLSAEPADGPADSMGGKGQAARAAAEGKQGCQVDGCAIEVGGMKDYHSRYKICEFHLKAHVVQKDGRQQRFCQQCGKFQLLSDFDGDKRSCRARLDKHNARRRRQREMAHMLKKTGTIDEKVLAEKYGLKEEELAPKLARMSKQGYSAKPAYSGSEAPSTGASLQIKLEASPSNMSASVSASQLAPAGAATSAPATAPEREAQATLLLAQLQAQQALHEASMAAVASAGVAAPSMLPQQQALLAGMLGSSGSSGAPPLGAERAVAAAAAAAPSAADLAANVGLLLDDDFLEEVFHPMMDDLAPGGGAQPAQPGHPATQFLHLDAASAMDLDDLAGLEHLTNELMAVGGMAGMHLPIPAARGGALGVWPSAPMAYQAPGLSSMPDTPSSSDHLGGAVLPPYLTAHHRPPMAAAAAGGFPGLLGGTPFGGLQPPPPLPGAHMRMPGAGARVESPPSGRSTTTAMHMGGSGTVLDEALNLLSYDSAQITYVPEDKLVRFSAKLFNCTPAQLPSDLKASLVNMLSCQSMEGYLRPGCVHITVNALMGPEEHALLATSGVRAVVERLVSRQPEAFWSQHAMLVQLGDKLALVREGRVVHVLATANSSMFPKVSALRPLVAEPNAEGSVQVSVWGYNLDNEDDVVLARSKGLYVEVERVGLTADPAWQGMQRLDLRLTGVTSAGAVQLEVMRGGYISGSKAMLVSADRALAAEVRALEAEESATDIDTLLFQLAASEEFIAAAAGRAYTEEDRRGELPPLLSCCCSGRLPIYPARVVADNCLLGKSSRRLLAFSVQRKWVAATRTLLASCVADQSAADAMSSVDVMCGGMACMPLLQLAVRSQNLELVRTVLAWGEEHDYVFRSTTPGRRGLTALHLAGLVNDGGAIAVLLTEKCTDAMDGWESAKAEDNTLPIDFARRTGVAEALERFIATKTYQQINNCCVAQAAEEAEADPPQELSNNCVSAGAAIGAASSQLRHRGASKAQSIAPSDSASSSRNPSKTLPEDAATAAEEPDHIAAEKAMLKKRKEAAEQEQGSLPRFRNPDLEAKYQGWYSAGQVPVDIAFLVIATLSQGAWIFRWSMDASWLGMAMVALMAMNAAMMQLAILFPSTYIHWREPLCVWSHVVHKLAQTAVTLVPPVGTIFSGGACNVLMILWQALSCFVLPCALVYASEKRSRRIFLETVSD